MNIEVEIKVKVAGFKEIKKKLAKCGNLAKSIKQIDEYYIPCHRDFFAKKPHPVEWLRIRTNPDKTIFEYDKSINKRANGLQDCAHEYETEVSRPDELRKILEFLDFKKVITVQKQREYWNCGGFEVALDDIKGLGFFVEVEVKGNFKNAGKARRGCIDILDKLGVKFSEKDLINIGYPVLLSNSRKFI